MRNEKRNLIHDPWKLDIVQKLKFYLFLSLILILSFFLIFSLFLSLA